MKIEILPRKFKNWKEYDEINGIELNDPCGNKAAKLKLLKTLKKLDKIIDKSSE